MQNEDIEVTLQYQGKQYTYRQQFQPWKHTDGTIARSAYEVAEYIYEEGNYACDCNRSLFLEQECGVIFPAYPDNQHCPLFCDTTQIKLISLKQIS